MKPLEAVARAICAAVQYPHEHPDVTNSEWPLWENEARAAITALRDCGVTEGMENASLTVADWMIDADTWRAMLDAVLEER